MEGRSMKPGVYQDEGYRFRAAAFEIYNGVGFGLSEEIYQECLEIELELRGISFRSKFDLECFYKGQKLRKRYFPHLCVMSCLIVELKSVTQLAPEHEAQLLNYMRIAHQPVGYLLNFGHRNTLEWKRFILSEYIGHATPAC
jgi:GxxExxY protein